MNSSEAARQTGTYTIEGGPSLRFLKTLSLTFAPLVGGSRMMKMPAGREVMETD